MSNCAANLSVCLPQRTLSSFPFEPIGVSSSSISFQIPSQTLHASPVIPSEVQKSPSFAKNLSKKAKNQSKPNGVRTCKRSHMLKKTIKKPPKLPAKAAQADIFEVSGSTSASNATPKIGQPVFEDFVLENEEGQSLRNEGSAESSQNTINSCYLEPTLEKFRLDENKFSFKDCLANHEIRPQMRAKMVDWMIEVLANFGCRDETFFLSVNLLDRHLRNAERPINPSELHLIGVTCMFIASKYEEVMPMKLAVLCDKAGYGEFTKEDIKEKELNILESLNFDVMGPNLYSFVQILANKLNVSQQVSQEHSNVLSDLMIYMSKMVLYEYCIVKECENSLLAAAVSLVAFKLYEQVDKSFNIAANIQKAKALLNLNENDIIDKANQILLLAKNFDKIYQSENNLKKFNQQLFDELQKSQKAEQN